MEGGPGTQQLVRVKETRRDRTKEDEWPGASSVGERRRPAQR